uniref:Uncharacterized protein n=1 Tax=Odontella aurita TaxID=265563 RepID=A0A7S4J0Z3_9STRA|mmetsp:Transcript_35338/g.105550  ORF Transcript_35338/g.105550 Transcript_35338/m.105550 type:complete len:119 (+) Transcript_35338:411-767(+)
MYGHLYEGFPSPQNITQIIIFSATILLPIYITKLTRKAGDAERSPSSRLREYHAAAAKVETEIYLFQARAGPYLDGAAEEVDTILIAIIQKIHASVEGVMDADGTKISEDFWEQPVSS